MMTIGRLMAWCQWGCSWVSWCVKSTWGVGGGLTWSRICIICYRWLHCWQEIWAQWGFTGIFWGWRINGMERAIPSWDPPEGTTRPSWSGESVAGKRVAICFRWTFVHRKGRHTKWGEMRRMRSGLGQLCGRRGGSAWWIEDRCQMERGDNWHWKIGIWRGEGRW